MPQQLHRQLAALRCIWGSGNHVLGLDGGELVDDEEAGRNHSPNVVVVGGAGNGFEAGHASTYRDALDEGMEIHCPDAHTRCDP